MRALAARDAGRRAALVTVVEAKGSTPRKPGARMLVLDDGSLVGTIGGGRVEQAVTEAARRVVESGVPELVRHQLTAELAMCCGGQMTFFVEPVMRQPPLIVFGLGHVGSAIVYAASQLGFEIVGVDDKPENSAKERLPQASRLLPSYDDADFGELPFGEDACLIIATREHQLDQRLLEYCLPRPWRYLGVIGSERKAAMQRQRLLAKGFDEARVAAVRCPMGLDIGAETPEEIAVSVCAELVAVRRGVSADSERR